ncbi:MAG TPA: MBL fold metallo-hydrolase [Dongiaceae bacterium]|nr:MBL fold metallo-hydrolase [Dongiaceae bacterium]
MKLTKFEHACLVLEKEGTTLVIDPGNYSHDFIMPSHVDGIVITHEHPDHLDQALIGKILAANPKAAIIAHESITGQFSDHPTIPAHVGETHTVGAFTLQFFGGTHASISSSMQVPPNLGVLVDSHLYYPGDSFAIPEGVQVVELAIPVSAPWLKISETIDFLNAVKPHLAFPTHDAILSNEGKALVDKLIGSTAHSLGAVYKRLDGSSVDL